MSVRLHPHARGRLGDRGASEAEVTVTVEPATSGLTVLAVECFIIYAGTRAHYFGKYRDDIERVLASVRLQ